MNIIRTALRRPISVLVMVVAIIYFSFLAMRKIKVDIFPEVQSPAIYIAMPYGGLSASYMDGFMANQFQKVLIFVSGVKSIDLNSVQGMTLMKLNFSPGTNMAQAAGEVATQVSRAMAFLPPGAVPPQVVRFDAGSQPVGQLVFESDQRSIGELQNLVLTRVRPMFVNIDGITAPAPFGGNARTMVINVNQQQMRQYGLTPELVLNAIAENNFPSPAGNIQIGDENFLTPVNTLETDVHSFNKLPVKQTGNTTIFLRDIASVSDGADNTTGYALVNGKRTVYLPIIKKSDASTLSAVKNLKAAMPMLSNLLPEDVHIEYTFDQSGYIAQSLNNLMHEALLGALLTGLMVLLFLGDKRGALIVVLTIPIAILSSLLVLYLTGQTLNIMTLSGLALAIGVLVDEATVTIENIHQHFEKDTSKQRAILDALLEISIPKFLILLCILAVLLPTFMMTGIPRDMFMPLSIAVGSAMIASFLASQTFIPVIANYLMKKHSNRIAETPAAIRQRRKKNRFERFKRKYLHRVMFLQKNGGKMLLGYGALVVVAIILGFKSIGTDILPPSDSKDIQLRIQAPPGTSLDKTEEKLLGIEKIIRQLAGSGGVRISSAFVGMHSPNSPINPIFLFTSSSSEAVLQLSLDGAHFQGEIADLKEAIRQKVARQYPDVSISFEPMELVQKIMGQGTSTPIAVKVLGKDLVAAEDFAGVVQKEMKKIPYLRDLHIKEPIHYPSYSIQVDREKLSRFGITMKEVSTAMAAATSSSRFIHKNMWVDPVSGLVFQVQLQFPESSINSLNKLQTLPLTPGAVHPVLADVATIKKSAEPAQVNRQGPNRYVTLTANLHDMDLGQAATDVRKAIDRAGKPPRGLSVSMIGPTQVLENTLSGLQTGLLVAVIVIFLMLTAYYQSVKIPMVILTMIPAVLAGSMGLLLLVGSSLNLQSYMGIIMGIGVSVSNAVLIVNQAEVYRKTHRISAKNAALQAVASRFRPVLMTTCAMIAGMTPMALAMGEGGGQVAPLGQAVIGGLFLATIVSLFILPLFYSLIMRKVKLGSRSLDPDDAANPALSHLPPAGVQ